MYDSSSVNLFVYGVLISTPLSQFLSTVVRGFVKTSLRSSVVVVLSVLALGTLAGCDATPEATTSDSFAFTTVENARQYAHDKGYDDAAKILDDGVVSADEYRAANADYQLCLEAQGYVFHNVMIDPVGGLQFIFENDFTGSEANADVKAIDRCQDQYDPVEQSYTLSQPQRMDPQLLETVKRCLDGRAYKYDPESTNLKTLAGSNGGIPIPVSDCVTREAETLFPHLPALILGY